MNLNDFANHIPMHLRDHEMVIITDNKVKKLYAQSLILNLTESGFNTTLVSFPAGEKYKNRETKAKIESTLLKKRLGRQSCIIALGGGVVGDMAGFVAATYLRGIPYIQVPTSLLAMVDSSVGGKTAVNTPEGKNLIGAFWESEAVFIDFNCLNTLPIKHRINGWVEALKMFLIADQETFEQAIKNNLPQAEYIQKAIALKSEIVRQDPTEQNIRAVLNLGHTIGHALERASNYRLLHGFAVAYGILIEAKISLNREWITSAEYHKIASAFEDLGFYGASLKNYNLSDILSLTKQDKKNKSRDNHYVLLGGIGHIRQDPNQVTHAVSDQEVKNAWNQVVNGGHHER